MIIPILLSVTRLTLEFPAPHSIALLTAHFLRLTPLVRVILVLCVSDPDGHFAPSARR